MDVVYFLIIMKWQCLLFRYEMLAPDRAPDLLYELGGGLYSIDIYIYI